MSHKSWKRCSFVCCRRGFWTCPYCCTVGGLLNLLRYTEHEPIRSTADERVDMALRMRGMHGKQRASGQWESLSAHRTF